ncbi:MAG: FitA-like ribbon-helix-helix domain-containing protein [Thermoleophilia bacterium]
MMSDVLIRNIPDQALQRLKQQAVRRNRSLQQELHGIITRAAYNDVEVLVDRVRERRSRYEVVAGKMEDSTSMIRRDRSR